MKKLFNDPRFVGFLVVVTVLYLSYTHVLPLLNAHRSHNQEATYSDQGEGIYDDATLFGGPVDLKKIGMVNRKTIAWISNPVRDPFDRQSREILPKLASAIGSDLTRQKTRSSVSAHNTLPVLKALFYKNVDSKAVINGELVGIGEKISGYLILEIDRNSVVLGNSGIEHRLYPTR